MLNNRTAEETALNCKNFAAQRQRSETKQMNRPARSSRDRGEIERRHTIQIQKMTTKPLAQYRRAAPMVLVSVPRTPVPHPLLLPTFLLYEYFLLLNEALMSMEYAMCM